MLKLTDGDEILIPLHKKTTSRFKGHMYDTCCDCGLRHHTIFVVEINNAKPQLTLEIYTDTAGSSIKHKNGRAKNKYRKS